jgi:PKD domain/Peptidase family M23
MLSIVLGAAFIVGVEPRDSLASAPPPTRQPLMRVSDLDIGELQQVQLCNGVSATVKLVELQEFRDPVTSAVREAKVVVEVNSQRVSLSSGNYRLPVTVAEVQVDCPITRGYLANSTIDHWALAKAARLRLWPAGSPWFGPGTFEYPVRQRVFATATQMANEPCFVDGGEIPSSPKIYYHSGLDIGGAEGMVPVVAAVDGLVVCAGRDVLPGYESTPVIPRYDNVYLLDGQGWLYRYSHLQSIDPSLRAGATVKIGQTLGVLGKEGDSGGWSHLHFEILSRQPSGRWGTQEGYAFLWEAYLRQFHPDVIAVARPHHFVWAGENVLLDATRSWSKDGPITRFDWTFSDGTRATGSKVERTYPQAGSYSEILRITDGHGHAGYDFAVVQVVSRAQDVPVPPTIHAAYAPSLGIKPGAPVTFKVRTFRTTDGSESWDFGDGSPPVTAHSDGAVKPLAKDGYDVTIHRFGKPGDYLVRVERADNRGQKATARLHVHVDAEEDSLPR